MSDEYLDDYGSFNSTTFSLLKTIDDLTRNEAKSNNSNDFHDPDESNDFPDLVESNDFPDPVELNCFPDPIELNNFPDPVESNDYQVIQRTDEPQQFNETKRICTKCGLTLSKNSKYRALCIKCYNKSYAEANKEKFREYHRLKYLAKKQQLLNDGKQVPDLTKLQKPKEEPLNKSVKNKGQCAECGVSGKLLLKTKCVRCYQRAYQRRYRPKNGFKSTKATVQRPILTTNSSVDSTNFSYLVESNDNEEPNTSNAENNLVNELPRVKLSEQEFKEKVIKVQKYCQECGCALSSKTTISRCKKCNKNHHRRASRKRVRERILAQSQRACSTCGVFFKAPLNANHLGLKCPDCVKKEKEDEMIERINAATEDDDAELFQYLSTLTTKPKNSIPKSKSLISNFTGKSRGNCEDCGEELPARGYLMKCRRCNKKDYKKRMRLKKREETQIYNPLPTQVEITKMLESPDNQNITTNNADNELISNDFFPPSDKSKSQEKRYCIECSVVLHTLCRYNLCRRCNKKRYKREFRKRKREERLAESSNCEENLLNPIAQQSSAASLNQMIDLFNDENCEVDETPLSSQSLLDYFISQSDNKNQN